MMGIAHSTLDTLPWPEPPLPAVGPPLPTIEYDENGRFLRWGPPNHREVLFGDGRPYHVVPVHAWRVIHVTVWCRRFDDVTRLSSDSNWGVYEEFIVERMDQVWVHFSDFFLSGGIANRFRFDIERWIWTAENHWEPHDYM